MAAQDAWVARWTAWCERIVAPSVIEKSGPSHTESTQAIQARERLAQCEDDLLRTSPMVRFMVKHLALIQCDPLTPRGEHASKDAPPKLLIASCPPDIAGGFSPSPPGRPPSEAGILLCANRLFSNAHLVDT